MNTGSYAACAGWKAQAQALEIVAHNLANLNTSGYRAQQATFRSLVVARTGGLSAMNRAANQFGVLSGARLDLSAGNLEKTGNPLDLAIEGSGYFVLQTPRGTVYSRNGGFQISREGKLVNGSGDQVMGEQGPISVPSGEVTISGNGMLSVNGAVAGKLKLVDFAAESSLAAAGDAGFSAAAGDERVAAQAAVFQGMRESSNVNAISAVSELIAVQRQAEMLQRALSIFHSEFDRVAAADLPRV